MPATPQLFPEPPPGRPPGAEEEEPETAEPEERHPVAAILSAVVILAALGVTAFVLIRPLPCDRAGFTSPNLGYCLSLPAGWTATPDDGQGEAADQFTQDSGVAAITVQAVEVPTGSSLETVAGQIRTIDQNAGFTVTDPQPTAVGGAPATTWVATSSGASIGTTETVVLKDGSAWRITFSDVEPPPPNDDSMFQDVLASWHFK